MFSAINHLAAQKQNNPPNLKILVQNIYYPKAGLEDAVFQWRLHASRVRQKLNLPVGRVLKRIQNEDQKPYVIWESEYPSLEARAADVEKIGKSKEFEDVQEHMGTLIDKFERSVWELHEF